MMRTDKSVGSIRFIGGAGTVTGSKILLEDGDGRMMIDCGLFQGVKQLRELNRAPLGIDPAAVDSILLTHAHLDHCGYLPLMVKNGFKGDIHCTYPTIDLAEIILRDSGKIQEEEAERANRYGYTRHKLAKPLYTLKDAESVLPLFLGHNFDEWIIVNNQCKFRFLNSGHILGSAFIELRYHGKTIIFSGDIGRKKPLLLNPPKQIEACDHLILESTYGGRTHATIPPKKQLLDEINEVYTNNGVLLIPAFAVERSQEIIYYISELIRERAMPEIPVYLDSPMGADATEIMMQYPEWTDLSEQTCREMMDAVKLIRSVEMSKEIVKDNGPKIVLAGSGMVEGGRILHYLAKYIDNPACSILLVGFQAAGTRGRALLEHAGEIKIFGKYRRVKAKVQNIGSLSAHADQTEIMDWISHIRMGKGKIFINHGEPHQSDALRAKIEATLHWNCIVAEMNHSYDL